MVFRLVFHKKCSIFVADISTIVQPIKALSKMKKLTMMIAMLAMTMAMQAQTKFHDVEANEAQGKVKAISMNVMGQPRNTEFTEDGKMKQEGLTDAKYDENGYIQSATMSMMGQTATVKFTWENGRIKSQAIDAGGQEIVQTYVYDDKGLMKAQKMNMMGQDIEIPLTDYKFDDKGNWISRKMSMMGQEVEMTRTITYFE